MASTQNGKLRLKELFTFPIFFSLFGYHFFILGTNALFIDHAEGLDVKHQLDDTSDNEFHDAEEVVNQVLEEKFSDALDLNDEAAKAPEPEPEPEPELSEEEKLTNKEKAEQLKQEGNATFKNADYEKSIELYTEAIAICPKDFSVERSILFSNRAAAHKHLGAQSTAIEDCTQSIELNPNYIKAYSR